LFQVLTEYKTLTLKVNEINKKGNSSDELIKEIAYLDKIIGKQEMTKEMVQQGIVSFVTENHPKVSINDLQSIHIFPDGNYTIITNQLDVTGNVNDLLQLAYDYEKKIDFSRIVSMNFYTAKKNNKAVVLHLKMNFQNYENNK
jgi:hypothetical protein